MAKTDHQRGPKRERVRVRGKENGNGHRITEKEKVQGEFTNKVTYSPQVLSYQVVIYPPHWNTSPYCISTMDDSVRYKTERASLLAELLTH